MSRLAIGSLVLILMGCSCRAVAQEQTRPPQDIPAEAPKLSGDHGPAQQHQMDEMAETTTAMTQMCEEMMQRERAMQPYVIASAAVLGTAFMIALVLAIMLEVQCIRLLAIRLKERRHQVP